MDLLEGNVKKLYFKYLSAAFGSSLISTIYSLVDMIVVGQNQGPSGTQHLLLLPLCFVGLFLSFLTASYFACLEQMKIYCL